MGNLGNSGVPGHSVTRGGNSNNSYRSNYKLVILAKSIGAAGKVELLKEG